METGDVIGGFPEANDKCRGCGNPLLIENAWMTDGCPCNSPLGINSMNETRWRLLMRLQQQQAREIERFLVGDAPTTRGDGSMADFIEQFNTLQSTAEQFGVDSVCILLSGDPLDKTETKSLTWKGGPVQALGLVKYAEHRIYADMDRTAESL